MKKNKYVFIALGAVIAFAVAVYLQAGSPFGFSFWAKFYGCIFSIAGLFFCIGKRLFSIRRILTRTLAILTFLISFLILATATISIVDYRLLLSPLASRNLSEKEWKNDLDFLIAKLPEKHGGLYKLMPEEKYLSAANLIKEQWDSLNENSKKVAMLKFVAQFNDGHTALWPFDAATNFSYFPLSLYQFEEGYFVINVPEQYKKIKHAKLLQVNRIPIEKVYERVKPYMGIENTWGCKDRFQIMGMNANILLHEKIISNINAATFTFQQANGDITDITIHSAPWFTYAYWMFIKPVTNDAQPMITNFRKNWYWYKYDSSSKNLYIQISQTGNQDGRPNLDDFIAGMEQKLRTIAIDKTIIDFRNNRGGDQHLLIPLVEMIKQPKYNRKGKLFIISSRTTYSAAVVTVVRILNQTDALLVGEPMGQGYNFYANHNLYVLPFSKMKFNAPPVFVNTSIEEDTADVIYPDLPVKHFFRDFTEGKDVEMERINDFELMPYNKTGNKPRLSKMNPAVHLINEKIITGQYLFKNNTVVNIFKRNEGVWVEIKDSTPETMFSFSSPLFAVTDTSFATRTDGVSLHKSILDSNLIINWKGKMFLLSRTPAK